jgi:chitinase
MKRRLIRVVWSCLALVLVSATAAQAAPKPKPTTPRPTPTATQGPTPTLGPTPTPCPNCALPTHVITGYWQNFTNGAKPLKLRDVPVQYGLIAVAFAIPSGSAGAVTFSVDSGLSTAVGGYTNADFTNDIALLHSQGRKVILSIGGATGSISITNSSSAANFANSMAGLMTTFGFDGTDIDLENSFDPASVAAGLQQLASLKPGVIITMAPQTVDMQTTAGKYFQVALQTQSILTIVNMQYYNSGSMWGCPNNSVLYQPSTEDFLTGLACIQLMNGLRPDQVGLGLPASTAAAGKGYVPPAVVNAALDCLETGANCGSFHPTTTWVPMRGAMTWSINWDASNNYAWSTPIYSHFTSLP